MDTHTQIFNAIHKGKRGIPIALPLKVDQALGLEEGTFALLQTFYDIQNVKENELSKIHPDLSIVRKILFWDTDIHKIDWQKQCKAVIQRVFEREIPFNLFKIHPQGIMLQIQKDIYQSK